MEYFIARSAVFNSELKVFGYELAFRSGFAAVYNDHADEMENEAASSRVISESFLSIGMDALTYGKLGFTNFSANLLRNDVARLFPSSQLALQINSEALNDPELVAKISALKKEKYTIMLTDYQPEFDYGNLLSLIDIVRVDREKLPAEIMRAVPGKVPVRCLLKNVHTMEELMEAQGHGYSYFQGDFFSRPFVLAGREISGYKLNYMQMLREVRQQDVDLDKIEAIIKRDISLSYKLLRLINSAAFGLRREVQSIRQALVLLGSEEIRKWITLIAMSNMGEEKPDELVKSSLFRARFCEQIGISAGLRDRTPDLFLMGMFSLIDAFVDKPMAEVMDSLPLAADIKATLLGKETEISSVYQFVIAYESGDWETVFTVTEKLGVDDRTIPKIFMEAHKWVSAVFDAASETK
jgi:c-di-GMP-related signal transduction protein